MDKIVDGNARKQRHHAVANLDVDTLLSITDAANEYVVAGLCGNPDAHTLSWGQLVEALRDAGLADS